MRNVVLKSLLTFSVAGGILCAILLMVAIISSTQVRAQQTMLSSGERLITVHDNGQDRGILTRATTLRQAFLEANIAVDPNDLVEPGLDEQLVASNYDVNMYRARPVTVVDGAVRLKVMSPYQTAKQIAFHAGIILQDEDIATLEAHTDMVSEGAGIRMNVTRATPLTLVLYGTKTTAYTQAKTVGEMLASKNITIASEDTLSVAKETPIQSGMLVELWRNGKQTATEEHDVAFPVEKIKDADRPMGYKQVKTPGTPGKRTIMFEIEMRDGKEVARKEIQSVITKEPIKQVEIVGVKSTGGLSKSKGVFFSTDSNGVLHRETYYDLPMNVVMSYCGGGTYTVRSDGAKVDKDGYILVAASLPRYPRCSLVETSLGAGKVYDTGGFTSKHPDGFDLATDWSNNDGR